MLDAGLDFFTRADGGVLRTLVQEYPLRVASAIKSATDIVGNLILATIYFALMLSVSVNVTLIATALVGLAGFFIDRVLTVPLARNGLALSVHQERWNTLVHETGLGLKLIRLLRAESLMRGAYRSTIRDYFRYDGSRQLIGDTQSPLMTTIGGLFVCGMLIYGSSFASEVDTAHLLVLVLCLYRLTGPVSRAMTSLVAINTNLDAMLRLDRFTQDTKAALPSNGSRPFSRLRDRIRFSDVTFTYPAAEQPALCGFDLTIKRGEMIALVGPSGAGKTSVVNLLGRLYEPQGGQIEIDGIDLRDYDVRVGAGASPW